MKRVLLRSLAVAAAAAAFGLSACSSDDAPLAPLDPGLVITSIAPSTARVCDLVSVRGRGFVSATARTIVRVGGVQIVPLSLNDSLITFRPAPSPGPLPVMIIVGTDTVTSSALSVAGDAWKFERVVLTLADLVVLDTFVTPSPGGPVGRVGLDTIETIHDFAPVVSCGESGARLYLRYINGEGHSANSRGIEVALRPVSGDLIDSLHIYASEFRYGGMLGSYTSSLGIILRSVPYALEADGSVTVDLTGSALMTRMTTYEASRGDVNEHQTTLYVQPDNPDARLSIRLSN